MPERTQPAADRHDPGPLVRLPRRHLAVAALLILAGLLVRTPSPEYFLMDPDGGVQLAAAQQIRLTGEQPWIDFYVPYGPLVYYLSFLGQWASGDRLIGEIVLCVVGYAIAYLALFAATLRRSGSPAIAFSLLIVLLVVVPRFHKYYLVLAPALGLLALVAGAAWHGNRRAVALGLAAAVGVGFRLDLGAFVAVAAVVSLLADLGLPVVSRLRLAAVALLTTAAALAPWLILIAVQGGHGLTADMVGSTILRVPTALSLPHPLLDWHHLPLSLLYLSAMVPLAVAATLLARRWRRLDREGRVVGAGTVALAATCMVITANRPDLPHLLQGIPLGFVAFAILSTPADRRRAGRVAIAAGWLAVSITAAAGLLMTSAGPADSVYSFGPRSVSGAARSLRWACRPTEGVLADILDRRPELVEARLANLLATSTAAGDRVVVWPFASQVVYFSRRPFAGLSTVALSGHFDSARAQRRILAALADQRPEYVLWDEGFMLDGRTDRTPTTTSAEVHAFVRRHWRLVDRVGRFSVLRRFDSAVAGASPAAGTGAGAST